MRINKSDVELLDQLINVCINKGMATVDDLPAVGSDPFFDNNSDVKRKHYKRLFNMIDDIGYAQLEETKIYLGLKEIPVETKRFKESGGFKTIYKEQQRQDKIERAGEDKLLDESKLVKWHKNTYWWTFGLAILGSLLGAIALVLQLI